MRSVSRLILFMLLGGLASAEPTPPLKQQFPLPDCHLKAQPNRPVSVPLYNEVYQWQDLRRIIERVEFRRTNTLDAYGRLTFYYRGGQLTRVEESTGGITGYGGNNWDIKGGKVVKAEEYSTNAATQKSVTKRLPLNSMPALYLDKPTAEWRGKVACRPFQ